MISKLSRPHDAMSLEFAWRMWAAPCVVGDDDHGDDDQLARLAMLSLHMCMPHDYMRIGSITNFIDSTS